jgi:riboflavin kinase/FMN adenylyltransferase
VDKVITIGKFEGIHLGHRALLQEVSNRAKAESLQSAALIFKPHPFKFLYDKDYKPIFTEHEREKLLRGFVNDIITLNFDSELVSMKASDFCKKLFTEINAREIVVGENYRFGNKREGTTKTLHEAAAEHNAKIRVIKNVDNISTSDIRSLLCENKFKEASRLLGFPFFIEGTVEKGRQLGRVLGFPTLNIYPPEDKFLPMYGVYKTRAIIDGKTMAGITNIGIRPTVDDSAKLSVETHVPDLTDELYGHQIKVEFLEFIRAEKRFENLDELKLQIKEDLHDRSYR